MQNQSQIVLLKKMEAMTRKRSKKKKVSEICFAVPILQMFFTVSIYILQNVEVFHNKCYVVIVIFL
jgi:hypothetical protein